jgi:hypothetical protein
MRLAFPSLFSFLLLFAGCGDDSRPTDTGMPPVDAGDGGGDTSPDAADSGNPECDGRPTTSPEPRGEVKGVYDADKDRLLVFGGNILAPVMCSPQYDQVAELWAFELDCNNWRQIEAAGGPSGRSRISTAVDTMRNRMLVFGGMEGDPFAGSTRYDEVWAFDMTADTWEQITTTGTGPTPKGYAIAFYDEAGDRLIVHGGDPGGFTGIDEMHALDLATNTWSEITPAMTPGARLYHGVTIRNDEAIIFGGAGGFGAESYLNDIWAFDMTTDSWRLVRGGGPDAPITRFGAEVFYDAAGDRLIVFGGHDSTDLGNSNDVHAYDFGADTWSEVRPGDTLNGAALGPCMFPADFTLPEDGMPTPDRRHSFMHAESGGLGYIAMGKTDCGIINDVWALDLAAGTWQSLRPPTGGEACNRSGATSCMQLCF